MKKSIIAILILLSVCFFGTAYPANAQTETCKFYVIKDFYENNWNRNWWDSGEKGICGVAGSVVYGEAGDCMTVSYSGNYPNGNNIMWGADNLIGRKDRDFSSAKYFTLEAASLSSKSAFQLIVSNSSEESENYYLRSGYKFYLVENGGSAVEKTASDDGFCELPEGFDGRVFIPVTGYPSKFNLNCVTRYSLGFPRGEAGKIRFGRIGYTDGDAAIKGGITEVSDETVYFVLPEKIVLEKAPPRAVTEPEFSNENNLG